MREIVTLQLGGFANFVGSHFWNFQDELLGLVGDPESDPIFKNHSLNMDVLYRSGETPEGVLTYTPRLVSVNYQGSLGSMSSNGTLYNQPPEVPPPVTTWKGMLSTQRSRHCRKNLFLQSLYEDEQKQSTVVDNGRAVSQDAIQDKDIVECLETDAHCWTDFSKVHYHPQSLYELSGLWMDVQEFDNYGSGKDVFSEGSRGEELNDRIRFFIEECDHIQGIQVLVDDSGGFSSVAADFLQNIADEYTNTPVLLYTVRNPLSYTRYKGLKRNVTRDLHDAISFARLSSFCKLIIPVGLPFLGGGKASVNLRVNDEKPYHCSAVYATALHSLSLPHRMDLLGPTAFSNQISGALDVYEIVQILSGPRQNMVAILDSTMPAHSLIAEQPLVSKMQSLTPEISEDIEDLESVETMVVQGVFDSGGQRASVAEVQQAITAAYGAAMTRPRFCHLSVSTCPLPIPLPFPSIFSDVVGQRGEILGNPDPYSAPKTSLDVHSIPVAAKLRSSSAILPFLSNRLENLRKFGIRQGALGSELVKTWGFGQEELEDMGETLSAMVRALDPFSDSDSDTD